MSKDLKTLHPAFEPGIFCSAGGLDDHDATPPGLTGTDELALQFPFVK
jgi:hypothetical protein